MKIKLLKHNIEFIKVDSNSGKLETRYTGRSIYGTGKIYFDAFDSFSVLMHELYHMYFFLCGIDSLEEIKKELACDLFGRLIDQIMYENGDDIFIKLKNFANA